MKAKFTKFFSILGNIFTPKESKELMIPIHILLAVAVIPVTVYNLTKEARKAINKDYMDYEKMEIIFLDTYNNTNDIKTFSESVAKLPNMSGKMDENNIYTFMLKYMNKNEKSLEKNKNFISAIILNAKVKPKDFNDFFTDIFVFLGCEDYLEGMKYILKNKDIKQHIINNNFSFNMNKEEIIKAVTPSYRNSYKTSDKIFDYIKQLPEEDLSFNVVIENKKKYKM